MSKSQYWCLMIFIGFVTGAIMSRLVTISDKLELIIHLLRVNR